MPEDVPKPLLVYDQIDRNRHKTYFLFVFFTCLIAPYFAYLSLYVGEAWLLMLGAAVLAALQGVDFSSLIEKHAAAVIATALVTAFLLGVVTVWWFFSRAAALVVRLSGAVTLDLKQEPELRRLVENLCIGAGLPQPALYLIETPATNAYAIGRNPENAGVVVTRGLLDLLERRELEGVLAYAFSQIGNHETRLNSILTAFLRLLWFPYLAVARVLRLFFNLNWHVGAGCLVLLWIFWFPMILWIIYLFIPWSPAWEGLVDMYREAGIHPALAYFLMSMPAYCLFAAPLAALGVQHLLLRTRPFLHDANAVLLTKNPGALARALAKMAAGGNPRLDLSIALAHLCMVNPLSGWKTFLSVHPPVESRIAALAGMSREVTPAMLAEAGEIGARHATGLAAAAADREASLSTLRVEPKSDWTEDVTILEGDRHLTEMHLDAAEKKGQWYVAGNRAGAFQKAFHPGAGIPELARGDLFMEVDGTFVARAQSPEMPFQFMVLEYNEKSYGLRVEKTLLGGRRYVLQDDRGAALGTVEGGSGFIRRLTACFPTDLPLHLRLFVIWLILVHWG